MSKCKAVVETEAMSKGAQRTWKCEEESKCRADVASSSRMLAVKGKTDQKIKIRLKKSLCRQG